MELPDRLRQIRNHFGLSQQQLGSSIGLKQGSYSDIERGKVKSVSDSGLKLLKLTYNINPDWVAHGTGAMLLEVPCDNTRVLSDMDFIHVPLVPIRCKAGYLAGYGDAEYIESLTTRPVIVDKEYKGHYRCFEVDGDSMDDGSRDSVCDRDIVLGREVRRELWQNKLHIKDWNFIIVHTTGLTVKNIVAHDVEKHVITCHPLNPMYPDYDLHLNDVFELYNLIKIVDRSARR